MTPKQRNEILLALKNEIKSNGPINLAQFNQFLENKTGYTRAIYAETGPKRWLQANFPEIEFVGNSVTLRNNPSGYTVTLPERTRQDFATILAENLETHGMLLHSAIPGLIPDWTKYRVNNEKLGPWLARTFREDEFATRIVNNAAALFMPQTAAEIDRIVKVVYEMLQSAGRVSISSIACRLELENMQWESLPVAHNQALEEWLLDYCPRITYSETDKSISILQLTPAPQNPSVSDANKQTVVYQYAFLPSVGSVLTALREAIQDSTYPTASWKKQSVDVFYDNLAGLGEGFLYDDSVEPARFAFNTGLQTPDAQHIYCIMIPNDMPSAIQPWRYEKFCYPGQNDPEGYGKWLCQKFGLPSENRDIMSVSYENIEKSLDEILSLQSALLLQMEQAESCIRLSNPVDTNFLELLSRYCAGWESIRTAVGKLSVSIPAEGLTVDLIQEILNKKGSISAVLDAMRTDYLELVNSAWSYMDETVGALSYDPQPEADMARWDERMAGAHLSEDSIRAAVQELLLPFRAMRALVHCASQLTDEQKQAWELLESHFNARLRARDLTDYFEKAQDDQVAFLDKIDAIEKRRKQIRITTGAAVSEDVPSLDDKELLRQVLNTCNVHLIHRHYPAINEFEKAVVTGELARAHAIAQDSQRMSELGYSAEQQATISQAVETLSNNFSTPILTAAINLEKLQGNCNRQAEKYYLLAIALKDGEATNLLTDLFYSEGRIELLWEVYCAANHSFPIEIRQKYLPALVDGGYLVLRETIRSDLLGFLAIPDTDTFDRLGYSGQLSDAEAENLRTIRQAIQEPFIQQITFMDGELYRFIQQQENIERIQQLGIHHTQESLSELLKNGNFPRGQDTISVAQRLWSFIKDWNGLAETVVLLAEDNPQKIDFLWNICQTRNDRAQMLQLLRQNPTLRQRYQNVYSELLFTCGAYQEYFEAFSDLQTPSIRMQLQFAVCAIQVDQWDGQIPAMADVSEIAGASDVIITLVKAMAEKDLMTQLSQFLQTYFESLLFHCGTETIEQIVSADGTLDADAILGLQKLAIAEGHTALAMFCSKMLPDQIDQFYDEAYYNQLWDSVYRAAPEEKLQSIRTMQLLFPEQYQRNYARIFPYWLSATLHDDTKPLEETAPLVAQMLTDDSTNPDTIDQILRILAEERILEHPLVQAKLMQLCTTQEYREACLRSFHAYRDEFPEKLDRSLCLLYEKALEDASVSQEFLKEAETVCLRQLCNYQDPIAAKCLCTIEEKLGRKAFCQFAALSVQQLEESSASNYEETATELDIFRQVLEDPTSNIDEYLQFCDGFDLFSEQDQLVVTSVLSAEQVGALTEAESIPLLHGFYENREDVLYLNAITRLPLRDNPDVYARLLFHCAQKATYYDNLMKICLEYCEKFQRDNILIEALSETIHRINNRNNAVPQWHDAKLPFASVRLLCSDPERLQNLSNPESIRKLLQQMCTFFRRIDVNSAASDHHNSLRTIIELAVVSGNADIVIAQVMDKLLGNYRKLGLAFAMHLLQHNNYADALQQLQALSRGFHQDIYPQLVGKLSQMSCNELAAWAEQEDSQLLIKHFILPDGNQPDIEMLAKFTIKCMYDNTQQAGIRVAEQLCAYFEKDSICHKILFILCKDHCMDNLPQLQQALAGLYTAYPMDRRQYYTRDRDTVLTLLIILSALMEQLRLPSIIDRDNISDFIRRTTVAGQALLNQIVSGKVNLYEDICSQFVGITEQEQSLLIHGLIGCITGNWSMFADNAYRTGISGEQLLDYLKNCGYCIYGLSRGFLQAAFRLTAEERSAFLSWIKSAARGAATQSKALHVALNDISHILHQNKNPDVTQYILQMPWEEHLVCLGDPKNADDEQIVDSCYRWMWNYLNSVSAEGAVTDALHLCHMLAQDDSNLIRLYHDADQAFRHNEYALAADIYSFFVNNYLYHTDFSRYPDDQSKKKAQARCRESYEARMRICRILQGEPDPDIVKKFHDMKAHSCANIIIALTQTARIDKLPQIIQYFQMDNKELCRGLLTVLDHRRSDDDKLAIYYSFESYPMAKHVIARILSTAGKDRTSYLFIQDQGKGRELGVSLAAQSENVKWQLNRLLTINVHLSDHVLDQISDLQWDTMIEADDVDMFPQEVSTGTDPESFAPQADNFVPVFVTQGGAADPGQDLASLRREYARYAHTAYAEKLTCARGIYFLVCKEMPDDSAAQSAALLEFGQAYHNYYLSLLADSVQATEEEKQQSRILARQALLDMAYYTALHRGQVETISMILQATGLLGILSNDFDSIDTLLDDYWKNQNGYRALCQYIGDKQRKDISDQIICEIHKLAQHHHATGPREQNTASYREAYKSAYDALEKLPFHLSWNQVKNTLLKLLMTAINNLDKRPFLDVQILNAEVAARTEFVTGTLSNTGRVPAENISIQAIFGDAQTSDIYGIKELFPNEKICFAIPFTAPENAATWTYKLNITYRHRDKEYTTDPFTGTLQLSDNNVLPADVDLYGAHKKMVFTTDEEGRIVSKGFYGREAQIESLKRLAPEGAHFTEYNRAIVQGFRRTGKTSLLHYFEEYLKSKCADQAIPIYVDCEGFSSQPVQKAFVSSILHNLEFKLPHLAEKESWNRLKNSWLLPEDAGDRNPDTLQFFYPALGRELEGKGVVLILDEIDRLFARLEETQGTASSLFPSLRAVQNNPACTAAICMILCGSNNMLIYNQNMGHVYQLFQDFPKITVGRLNKEDIQNILTEPLAENGLVEYHPDAIEWIWRYTGGLVWYTKLLGNAAVKQVKEAGRKYIYPIDISHALDVVVQGKDTKQYIDEGCTDDAKQVLDAMAALSVRYGTDVTLSQLTTLLDGALSETQLTASLSLLADTLGLLERSSNMRNAYHFAVEIYRRIYRNLDHYVYRRIDGPLDRTTITDLASEDLGGRGGRGRR